jgi:endonuclease/exonuclease/phosphatase family metal-dependent hydrolase
MRLVSFNIHHGTVGRRGPVDPDQLGEVCNRFEADVIALQEVDVGTRRVGGVDLAAVVAAACGMDHRFGASRRLPGGSYGNAVLVRGEIRGSTLTRLPKVPRTRFWQEQRTLLLVDALVDGSPLTVGCTHLAVKQWNNGPQLDFLLGRLAEVPRPLVVLGDFNRRRGGVADAAREVGLHAVEHGPTYPAGSPRTDIDHVLVSPQFRARDASVVSTTMSDHGALVVDLQRSTETS